MRCQLEAHAISGLRDPRTPVDPPASAASIPSRSVGEGDSKYPVFAEASAINASDSSCMPKLKGPPSMVRKGAASPQTPKDSFCAPKNRSEVSSLPRRGRWEGLVAPRPSSTPTAFCRAQPRASSHPCHHCNGEPGADDSRKPSPGKRK